MPGVLSIVSKKIGEGARTRGSEVRRFQQLLYMAGYSKVGWPDGAWGKNTTTAWMQYQEEFCMGPARPFVEGGDPENRLVNLAHLAGVLIPLANETGAKGMKAQFETMRTLKIPYGWMDHGNGTLMTWGLQLNGNVQWAICTKTGGGPQGALFDMKVPRSSNCTSLTNVLMSVWVGGNLHHAKYDSSQMVGGLDPARNLSRRFGYTPLEGSPKPPTGVVAKPGLYTSLEELEADTKPGVLYHFAICRKDGFITHDTVLLDGEIYECNYDKPGEACYKTPLATRWKRTTNGGKYAIVSGPM